MSNQLSLFDFNSFGIACVVPTTKAIHMPVAPQSVQEVKPIIKSSIPINPYFPQGFRPVAVPGLTASSPVSPCLTCVKGMRSKDACSENDFCYFPEAREKYLISLGVPLLSGVNASEGLYGITDI